MRGSGFSGNYPYSIDGKGRATIPSVYREQLGLGFTVGLKRSVTDSENCQISHRWL